MSLAGYFRKVSIDGSSLFSSYFAIKAVFLRFLSVGEYIWETYIDNLHYMNLLLIFSVKSQSLNLDLLDLWVLFIFLIMSLTRNSGNALSISLLSSHDSLGRCCWNGMLLKIRVFLKPLFWVSSNLELSFFISSSNDWVDLSADQLQTNYCLYDQGSNAVLALKRLGWEWRGVGGQFDPSLWFFEKRIF